MTKNVVTLNDIYQVVNRLEDKMDARMANVEKRVDVLEDFRGRVLGGATMVGAFAGAVTAWIWQKITGKV